MGFSLFGRGVPPSSPITLDWQSLWTDLRRSWSLPRKNGRSGITPLPSVEKIESENLLVLLISRLLGVRLFGIFLLLSRSSFRLGRFFGQILE